MSFECKRIALKELKDFCGDSSSLNEDLYNDFPAFSSDATVTAFLWITSGKVV